MLRHLASSLAALLLALLPSSCGGSTDSAEGVVPGSTSAMHLISCSLACSGPLEGPVGCTITEVFVNQTLVFEFNRPVDPASLNSQSVRVSELANGQVPPALIQVDPNNPRRVLYRAKVAFDDFGNVVPGLEFGKGYRVFLRGSGTGDRVRAVGGSANITTVDCFVVASKGVLDVQPGPPSAQIVLEQLDPSTGQPIGTSPADGATDVPLDTRVRIEFDQIMDAASIVDLATDTSSAATLRLDEDGDPNTPEDQVPLPGTFDVQFDEALGRTTLLFEPEPRLPSGGDPSNPYLVVVRVNTNARDVVGEPLQAAVEARFTPQAVPIPVEVVRDTLQGITPINAGASSAVAEPTQFVGATGFRGRVLPATSGGSGRLGELFVRQGEVVVLGTGPDVVSRFGPNLVTQGVDQFGDTTDDPTEIVAYEVRTQPVDDHAVAATLPGEVPIEVTDGVFEFATLVVESGGVLTFEGANPARVFVRGECRVLGVLDASGRDAGEHDSFVGFGGDGGPNRIGAGAGGDGGDRPDQPPGSQMLPSQGVNFRGFDHAPGAVVELDGAPGAGRGGAAPGTVGAGGGGVSWPPVFPGPTVVQLGTLNDTAFLNFLCASVIVGAPGAGGSYATAGTAATWAVPSAALGVPPAPPAAAVDPTLVRAFDVDLDPDRGGALVGGAGGGGGGTGLQGVTTNGIASNDCIPPGVFPIKQITAYLDGSGAAGGGGGGALQLHVGGVLQVLGLIDASGGRGGGFPFCPVLIDSDDCWTAPGGGGSGGALLVQAQGLDLSAPGRAFDVSGGAGGFNANTLSEGGHGGVGIVHVETPVALDPLAVAAELEPAVGGVGEPALADVVRTGVFADPAAGPGRRSGFTSCWILPEGGLFGFDFVEDDFSSADPSQWVYGWNLRVELDTGEVVQWRGDSGPINAEFGSDLETLLGNSLGSSPVVVRFQGLRFLGVPSDPCQSDLLQLGTGVVEESITPWAASPADLNTYWALTVGQVAADERRPNAVRAQVLFDPDAPLADRIVSVVEFQVLVQPR